MNPRVPLIGPKRCPVFLRLPWIGNSASAKFEKKIKQAVQPVFRTCEVRVCFTSKPMFRPCIKNTIPAHHRSNVIYLFECRCGHRYVGKTTQRLETRISQHLPAVLRSTRRRQAPSSKPLDLAIGQHLLSSTPCLDGFTRSLFTVLSYARSSQALHYLEPLYIKKLKPTLCKQLEFVKSLHLFPSKIIHPHSTVMSCTLPELSIHLHLSVNSHKVKLSSHQLVTRQIVTTTLTSHLLIPTMFAWLI